MHYYTESSMTTQENLLSLALDFGKSQREIADKLGVSQATVSRLIRGVHSDTTGMTALRASAWLSDEIRSAQQADLEAGRGND